RAAGVVMRLSGRAGEQIKPRRKVHNLIRNEDSAPRREYLLFLDECGGHAPLSEDERFPVFCLCGVVVDAERYTTFDRQWKSWKAEWLGSWRIRVHEPDVRRRSDRFHSNDPDRESEIIASVGKALDELDFVCISAVIDKRALSELHGDGAVDGFLPSSAYLMCLDFVIERFVHFLYYAGSDARGLVFAESRGAREDAEVHAEFIRLLLEGTQWQSDSWFRYQLRPYIEFLRKERNSSGLQVADLLSRPIAEKALQPSTSPERWEIVKHKFYDGCQARPASYGLKIYPAVDVSAILVEDPALKANEDVDTSPSTD
ncbi:MAG TPA: DUF3800 domain-containing protein, partial [Thermomicrobiaceae bacterium]|nr:DUF3800 domain-containing protein [Thermomicrobiaceae bacterium]